MGGKHFMMKWQVKVVIKERDMINQVNEVTIQLKMNINR
jgi:hypothetical protein